ncbi:hypothetical protein [uncultured Abiotrophia sp.]|uniref:hypothetical protein n=1 Tax=uncultured Abiotrophia sp. TaxID=316094 RepID=UPI0028D5359F|nr:hypothetical protein [uncultured Abiotrophia sp.]
MNQLDTLLAKIEAVAKEKETLLAEVAKEIEIKQAELASLKQSQPTKAKDLLAKATKIKTLEDDLGRLSEIEKECREGIENAGGPYLSELARLLPKEYDNEFCQARQTHNEGIIKYLKDTVNELEELISAKEEACKEAGNVGIRRIATTRKYTKLNWGESDHNTILNVTGCIIRDSLQNGTEEIIKEIKRLISRF